MPGTTLLATIAKKDSDKDRLAEKAAKSPRLIPELLEGLDSDKAEIRYGCAKILRLISEKHPKALYPKIDFFIDLLDHDNKILCWGAIIILANLARVDSKNKIEKIFSQYFKPISGPVLITAGNIIGGAHKIALAKPRLTQKIVKELLKVERARYQTDECRNIALGHTVEAFDRFYEKIEDKKSVLRLVRKQLKNSRNATRKKAERFLKKHAGEKKKEPRGRITRMIST